MKNETIIDIRDIQIKVSQKLIVNMIRLANTMDYCYQVAVFRKGLRGLRNNNFFFARLAEMNYLRSNQSKHFITCIEILTIKPKQIIEVRR